MIMLCRLSRHFSLGFKSTDSSCMRTAEDNFTQLQRMGSFVMGAVSQAAKYDAYRLAPPTFNVQMPLQLPKLIVLRASGRQNLNPCLLPLFDPPTPTQSASFFICSQAPDFIQAFPQQHAFQHQRRCLRCIYCIVLLLFFLQTMLQNSNYLC